MTDKRRNLVEIILLTMFGVLMYVLQVIMSQLPNIHPVGLIIVLLTIRYGAKSLLSVYVFAACEILTYGLGIWSANYLYVWAVLVLILLPLRKVDSAPVYALVTAIFGLFFGTLCSIPYFLTGGIAGGIAYIINGFVFDLLHCGGNFIIVLLLYRPLITVFNKVLDRVMK